MRVNKALELEVVVSPFQPTQSWDDAVRATLPTLSRWESESGSRIVVVQNRIDRYGGVLDELSRGRSVVTPRSKAAQKRGPVLAYVPVESSLLHAQRIAVHGLAVVAIGREWMTGWARAVGATNLATGERYEPFTESQSDALERVSWNGNNGWPPRDDFIRGPVSHALGELLESGLTMADITGAMYARGHAPEHVARLPKFI